MTTTTAATPALTMEILLDQGHYRHLAFRRGPAGWDLHTFPGGVVVRGIGFHVFANGAADIVDSFAFTASDPVYWAEKAVGPVRVWDEKAFRTWLAEEAQTLDLTEEVERFFDLNDLYTEAFAREALAWSGLNIDFPDADVDDFYAFDPHFLQALRLVGEGLAHYRHTQN